MLFMCLTKSIIYTKPSSRNQSITNYNNEF